jgi:outer membrane protein assembly factor BamB
VLTTLSACCALLLQTPGVEWGSFRGEGGTGLAAAGDYPDTLDPATNLRWRTAVPGGYSSPIVAGGRVFVTGARERTSEKHVEGELVTLCLDAASGAVRWQQALPFQGLLPGRNSCAAPTPATDGMRVVALFHHLGLVAFDLEGKELWRRPLGPFLLPHGMSSSPFLAEGLVVVQVDQDAGSYLAAFDATSGEPRWRAERPEFSFAYSSPVLHRPAEGPPQVVVLGGLKLTSYTLLGGELSWSFAGPSRQPSGVPLVAGTRVFAKAYNRPLSELKRPGFEPDFAKLIARDKDGDRKLSREELTQPRVVEMWSDIDGDGDDRLDEREWNLALSATQGGLFAVDASGHGDVSATHQLWRLDDRRALGSVTSPLLVGDTLFLLGDGGLLTSVSAKDGALVKQERLGDPDTYYASPVAADGKLYLASHGGLLTVARAEPEWQVLATHALEEAEIWATPALASGTVLVRSKEAVLCFREHR